MGLNEGEPTRQEILEYYPEICIWEDFDFESTSHATLATMPDWFALLIFALAALLPMFGIRFSLRALLIAATFVSALLGLAMRDAN